MYRCDAQWRTHPRIRNTRFDVRKRQDGRREARNPLTHVCVPTRLESCFRNVTYDGEYIDNLDPFTFHIENRGTLRLDYVSLRKPRVEELGHPLYFKSLQQYNPCTDLRMRALINLLCQDTIPCHFELEPLMDKYLKDNFAILWAEHLSQMNRWLDHIKKVQDETAKLRRLELVRKQEEERMQRETEEAAAAAAAAEAEKAAKVTLKPTTLSRIAAGCVKIGLLPAASKSDCCRQRQNRIA
eukprot:914886-Prorocentrum_minimum.AAC.1